MSFMFWFWSAMLVLAALAMLLWPLLGRPREGGIARQTALLREQMDALKAAHAAGLLEDVAFARRKEVLSAAALALVDSPAATEAKPRPHSAVAAALVLLVSLPLATAWLYQRIGTPHAVAFDTVPRAAGAASTGMAASGQGPAAQAAPDLAAAAANLAERLRSAPNDGEGWLLLGRTYRAIQRFGEAEQAFRRASELLPEHPDLLAEWAEARGLAVEPRSLLGGPEGLLDRALELDPEHQRALWLKGFARSQAEDRDGATRHWQRLLELLEPGSPVDAAVREQLARLGVAVGSGAAQSASGGGPAPAETGAAPAASAPTPPAESQAAGGIRVAIDIDPALRARLSGSEVLFVFARAEAGPPMPLAIQRLPARDFPLRLRLDESMGMVEGMSLSQFERVIVGARISASGNAQASPGDFEALSPAFDWRQDGAVELKIDRVR